jgi:hypothetical protein
MATSTLVLASGSCTFLVPCFRNSSRCTPLQPDMVLIHNFLSILKAMISNLRMRFYICAHTVKITSARREQPIVQSPNHVLVLYAYTEATLTLRGPPCSNNTPLRLACCAFSISSELLGIISRAPLPVHRIYRCRSHEVSKGNQLVVNIDSSSIKSYCADNRLLNTLPLPCCLCSLSPRFPQHIEHINPLQRRAFV